MSRPEHVAVVDLTLPSVPTRDEGRAVVDPPAPSHRLAGDARIAQVAPHALDVETIEGDGGAAGTDEHAHSLAFVEQPTNEIGAEVSGAAGDEDAHGPDKNAPGDAPPSTGTLTRSRALP